MATPVFINEFHYDNNGTDTGEFIEVAGPSGTNLSGWSLVLYNGNGGAPYQTESIGGTIPDLGNGFGTLVFAFPSNGIQNGSPDGIALVDDGANVVQFLSYEGSFTAVGGPADGLTSRDISVREESATPVGASLQLIGTGNVYEDFTWSGPSSSTSGAINTSQAFLAAPAAAITPISSIQGSGDASPLVGQEVTIEAIVVGDFQDGDADTGRSLRGFYVQEEDGDSDGNPLTSEGLFVFEGSTLITGVNLGDKVRITGTVDEFFGETQLDTITNITVISSGNRLPSAASISLPASEVSLSQDGRYQPDLEVFEGMRVAFTDTLTVSELFQLDRFNEIRLVQGARPQQFTQFNSPDTTAYEVHLQEVGARTIVYDDGLSVQNAAIGNLDGFGPVFNTANAPRMGDTISGLEGVLSYQWAGNAASGATWRVRSAADGTNTFEQGDPRPATPPDVGGSLKAASFNVLNFFATLDGGSTTTANGADPRGADDLTAFGVTPATAEFDRQKAKLITSILSLDADIIGLVELENDFLIDTAGNTSTGNALALLVDELNALTSRGRYAWVDPGTPFVGDDAIAVGFLYDTEAVSLKGNAAILDTPGFLDPNITGESRNRAALAQTFEEIASGEAFTAVVNHFKSKGASGLDTNPTVSPGDVDQGDGQGYWNDTRTKAAKALAAWLETDPTGSGDEDILILGDLNSYAKEDPITYLESIGYTDLARLYGGEDAYSYVFDGQTGSLDYILASPSLIAKAQISGADVWAINADEADALDYNLDFGRDPTIFDGSIPYRASDHDPLLVGLSLAGPPAVTETLPNGVASGDVDQDSVVLWARSTALGELTFTYSTDPAFTINVGMEMGTVIDPTLPVKVAVEGLEPGTRYYYKAEDAGGRVKEGTFVTATPVGEQTGLRFGVTGDWRGELAPYRAIANADEKELAFFVELGDTIYADYASPALPASQAITLEDYRAKHAEVYGERFGSNTWEALRASTAVFATIDDHEVINDFAGGQTIDDDQRFINAFFGDDPSALINDSSLYENGLQAFQEYNPLRDEFYGATGEERTADERKLYRFNTFGSDAATFLLDTRSFRDPALEAPVISDPADIARFLDESANLDRPFLGEAQLNDLKADLLTAQISGITWKFVMVPEPIQELGIYNVDAFEGYANERSEILRFIEDNDIDNVVFVAADIHGTVVNNLTYTDPTSPLGPRIATDVWEITTGSVAFDPPFGPTVVDVATTAGLLTQEQRAFYDTLPIAPDPDDLPDDKDDFLKAAFQSLAIGPAGYDPIGLEDNLREAAGMIGSFDVDATLLRGDWFASHTFGWTQFDIDPLTQDLLVTTYGIDPYSEAELLAEPELVLNREPLIVSQFTVSPEQEIFTLELLHIADQEAGAAAIQDAPRLSAVLNALRAEDLGKDGLPDNTLTLSSGDAFIPGLFYDASEAVFGSGGIGDIQIQNELGIQAIAFGNHEFDFGTAPLAGLIDGSAPGDFSALVGSTLEGLDFSGTDFPYLSTNLNFTTDVKLAPMVVEGGQAPQRNVVTASTVITLPANGEAMASGEAGFSVVPIFTVGETFFNTSGALNPATSGDYTPPGILDGLGAYKLDARTVRVFANHELANSDGYAYSLANGVSLSGARISYFDINKATKQIFDAGLAYHTIYNPDGSVLDAVSDLPESRAGFDRFCSGALFEAGQFGAGRGLRDRIYFAGEETGGNFSGVSGNEWALDVATGELWAVPAMGRGAWENITEVDTGSTTHVAFILMDDTSPFDADGDGTDEAAPMFLYVGEKNATGNFLERNGLANGKLYVWVADNAGITDPSNFNGTTSNVPQDGTWVELENAPNLSEASNDGSSGFDEYGYPTQKNLWSQAEALGAFGFSRPEDVATNPADGSEIVFASTGVSSAFGGADTVGTLYTAQLDFSDITAPTATVSILYDGDADPSQALRSPDNLDWADDGFIYVQEDRAASGLFGPGAVNPYDASILRIDPATGEVSRVAEINQDVTRGAVDENVASTGQQDIGNWESSGILDVSTLFGEAPGTLFLFDVQAHALDDQNRFPESGQPRLTDGELKEGGQLAFLARGADLGRTGEKIGVVGATTPTLDIITSPGDVTINPRDFDASPTPAQLDALAAEIQAEVDALLAANPGLNKVVLLAHMQQLDIERALAKRLVNVDIIVGGGSNTRLFDGNDRVRAGDSIQGPYPDFIVNAGGTTTALVNTDGSYKYVGRLVLDFDADGNILPTSYDPAVSGAYATDAQGVADLGAEGLIDPEIQAIVDAIEAQILSSEGNVFGISEVFLNGNRSGTDTAGDPDGLRTQETNLGNLTADANLAIARETDPSVVVSIKNGGGIRASIGQILVPPGGSEAVRLPNEAVVGSNGDPVKPEGGISQNDIQTTLAFNNGLTLLTLSKEELVAVLEHGVGAIPAVSGRFPQVSGVRFSYDPDLAPGDRLVNAAIVDEASDAVIAELVRDGELVGDPGDLFRIVTLNFLAGGGDGYPFPTGPEAKRVDLYDLNADGVDDGVLTGDATFAADGSEQDALAEYLATFFPDDNDPNTPVYGEVDQGRLSDERIQNLDLRDDTIYGADPITGTTVTRFYNTSSQLHFLTTSELERNILRDPITGKDSVEEGPAFESYEGAGNVDVMRYYNPSFGKHLWTTNAEEMQILNADSAWILEGRAFGAATEFTPGSQDTAVWRFYNNELFNHLYTTNTSEIAALSSNSNWVNEGVAFYV